MSSDDGGRFDLAPVAAKRRIGPVVVVVAVAVVVGVGLWKPWSSPQAGRTAVAWAAPLPALDG
jgi:hypothetical protein